MLQVVLIGIFASCLLSGGTTSRENNDRSVSRGDMLFATKKSTDDLQSAITAWETALDGLRNADQPISPAIWVRLIKGYTILGDVDDVNALQHYHQAQQLGVSCLRTHPGVDALVQQAGGILTPRALNPLNGVTYIECLSWTSISWARWVRLRGAAGLALDIPVIETAALRAVRLDETWAMRSKPSWDRIAPHHALGLALTLRPEPLSPDLGGATASLTQAWSMNPDQLTIAVDLAEWALVPMGDPSYRELLIEVAGTEIDPMDQYQLENEQAKARASRLLESGINALWSP